MVPVYQCIALLLFSAITKAQSPSAKARAMLAKMSLDEKILMLHGGKTSYTGGTPEIVNSKTGVRYSGLNSRPYTGTGTV